MSNRVYPDWVQKQKQQEQLLKSGEQLLLVSAFFQTSPGKEIPRSGGYVYRKDHSGWD